MANYYTEEQFKQVNQFVDQFIEKVNWMKSPNGVDSLADKCAYDNGRIIEASMLKWFIEMAIEQGEETGMTGKQLHDLFASAALNYSMSSASDDVREALKPLYQEYVK